MSEYWKSNPRKFCDFCKCWIADNKPSIEFHERGKRHKENVQKRLEEISIKGKEDYENKLKEGDYMREMEEAALKAYQKDIEKNPDFTATKISEIAEASNAKIVVNSKRKPEDDTKIKKKPKWFEAKSPEGFSYYYNKETGESVWEAPNEDFKSLEEQAQMQDNLEKKITSQDAEIAPTFGPMPLANPYGNWESTKQEEQVDLQLPYQPEQEYYAPVVIKKPEVKFTEKVVTLSKSCSGGSVSFKKRKGAEEHKKNVRRRVDD